MSGDPDPLAAVRVRFLERCRGDLATLQAAKADPALQAQEAFRTAVHRLSGAAGTFGYMNISDLAGDLDNDLHDGRPIDGEALGRLVESLAAIL